MIDRAWQAFVEDDEQRTAPPGLERRVIAAALAARRATRPAPAAAGARWLFAFGSAAAAVVTVAGWLVTRTSSTPPLLESRTFSSTALADTAIAIAPRIDAPAPVRQARAVAASPAASLPSALMVLDGAPLGESEAVQLVRLRLPRNVLQSLGLVLLEPDAEATVDVDVLVGEDGLARDIRQVRVGHTQR